MEHQKPSFIAKEEGDLIIVRVNGAINAQTLPESRKMIDELIKIHSIDSRYNLKILVDYQNVTDVDSATIANILDRMNAHKDNYHTLAFVNVPQDFITILEIHKLQDEVKVFASEEEALIELRKPSQ